jgi:type IX secretion system PorP/SprF family membrane protein
MSNPSFSNIDRWLFELVEGNLSPEQVAQLEAFLLQHPELDVDKDVWELSKIEKVEVVFAHQDKHIRRKPVGLYMVAGFVSMAIFVFMGINDYFSLFSGNDPFIAAESNMVEETKKSENTGRITSIKSNITKENTVSNVSLGLSGNFEGAPFAKKGSVDQHSLNQLLKGLSDMETALIQLNDLTEVSSFSSITEKTENYSVSDRTIETRPAREIEVLVGRSWAPVSSVNGVRYSRPEINESFSSKFNRTMRLMGRMLDNPVALKNLKDPGFSIPGMLPIDVNHGLIGTLPATRVQTMTRLQWYGKENEQFSNQLAIDGYSYAVRGGIGLQVNHTYYGDGLIENSNVALTYSPKFSVNRNILIEPSVRFKMGNKTIDPSKNNGIGFAEIERDNVHSFYPNGAEPQGRQLWYRDLGLGMMVNTKWFFAGIQTDNLFNYYDNIYSGDPLNERRAGTHLILTAGTDYESKREIIGLSPYIVYQRQENLKEMWMGFNGRISWITMGAAVSDQLDAVASIGLRFDHFSLTYSADQTRSALWDQKLLSHQLTLRYIQFNPNQRQKPINL